MQTHFTLHLFPRRNSEFCSLFEAGWLALQIWQIDNAEIRFFAVRSPRIWVSGYCTKRRIQGSFDSSSSRLLNVKSSKETQHLASIFSILSLNAFVAT